MCTRIVTSLVIALGACSSGTAWIRPADGEPHSWRHCRSWRGEHAVVLASSESAAHEAHELARATREAIAAETGALPPPGLLIACSADDPLLFADPAEHVAALLRWHAEATDAETGPTPMMAADGAIVDPVLAAHLVAAAVPPLAPELGLPAPLATSAPLAFLLPTRTCISTVADAMVEAAFEAEGISWLQQQMVYAIADPGEILAKRLDATVHGRLVAAWEARGAFPRERRDAVYARLGLEPPRVREQELPSEPLSEHAARALVASIPRFVLDDDRQIAVATTPSLHQLYAMRSLDYGLVVDLNPLRSRDAWVPGGAPRYEWLRTRDLVPGPDVAERLERLRRESPGVTLVCDDDPDRAAALWAAHAFWVRGVDAEAALSLARRLGMTEGFAPVLRARLVR